MSTPHNSQSQDWEIFDLNQSISPPKNLKRTATFEPTVESDDISESDEDEESQFRQELLDWAKLAVSDQAEKLTTEFVQLHIENYLQNQAPGLIADAVASCFKGLQNPTYGAYHPPTMLPVIQNDAYAADYKARLPRTTVGGPQKRLL